MRCSPPALARLLLALLAEAFSPWRWAACALLARGAAATARGALMAGGRDLLDTNICIYIYIAKNQPQAVRQRLVRHALPESAMSVITLGELRFGAEKSDVRAKALRVIAELSVTIPVFDLPGQAAEHYGDIRARLHKRGFPIGNNDLWIAALARSQGWTVVSNNVLEFARLPGLSVENWAG